MDSFKAKYNRDTAQAKREAAELLAHGDDNPEVRIFKAFQDRARKDQNPVMLPLTKKNKSRKG